MSQRAKLRKITWKTIYGVHGSGSGSSCSVCVFFVNILESFSVLVERGVLKGNCVVFESYSCGQISFLFGVIFMDL